MGSGRQSVTTDSNGGNPVWTLYYPWGGARYSSGSTPTSFGFTGQRWESSLNLYYYGARWYDQSLGRFIQADSIIPNALYSQAFDRYAYTNNNPINYTDPSGHFTTQFKTDQCGPDGLDCNQIPQDTYDDLINWGTEFEATIDPYVKLKAEQAFIHALRDPNYFRNLYFSTSWGNQETQYLEIYLQYSEYNISAEKYLFQEDINTARIMRSYIISGHSDQALNYMRDVAVAGGGIGITLLSLPFKDPILAQQVKNVVESIDSTGYPPLGVRQGNGGIFLNREGYLPNPINHWIESDVYPGTGPRGALRIVMEPNGEVYFTVNHYAPGSFVQIR